MTIRRLLLIPVALVLHGQSVGADEAADRCRAAKALRAGVYSVCRVKAEAVAIRRGSEPDFAKCERRLAASWAKVEEQSGGACPTVGDAAAIRDQVAADVAALLEKLTPPPVSPPPCGDAATPGCGGPCPPGLACWSIGALPSSICGCLAATATACGDTGGPITNGQHCGGACPDGQVCATLDIDVSSLDYTCGCIADQSIPCLNSDRPSCGGACPDELQCAADPLVFDCRCR